MENDKFFNYYVEILNTSLQDAIGKNIVFQAQDRIAKEKIEDLSKQIIFLEDKLREQEKEKETFSQTSEELVKLKSERDHAKLEASHLETFRNELISARSIIQTKNEEIEKLKNQIEYLQMTPAQKRKVKSQENKDGGSF